MPEMTAGVWLLSLAFVRVVQVPTAALLTVRRTRKGDQEV